MPPEVFTLLARPSTRSSAPTRPARLRRPVLVLVWAIALASAGCVLDESPFPRPCADHTLLFDGQPVGTTPLSALPSTSHRIERLGGPGGFFHWSMTPSAGGSLTSDATGATVVTPPAAGRYTVQARSEVRGCTLTATIDSGPRKCSQPFALLRASGGAQAPVSRLWLTPGQTVTLRSSGKDVAASATGGELVGDGPGQWKYTAPTQPGEYSIGATCTPAVGVVVGNDCFGAVATTSRFGVTTPFGPNPLFLEAGGKLSLALTKAPPGAAATFSLVESPLVGTVVGGTYTAPAKDGYATLLATVKVGAEVLCTSSQPLVVSTPKPIRTPWPAELLSVAGSTIAGGSPTSAVRANTDGGGFEEVSAQAARIGGVAATADGVFWTQAAETTTALVGSVPAAQTVYDSVIGAPGAMTSDGRSLFYFASEPFVGGTLRKVTPPSRSGVTVATLPPGDLVDAVAAANGSLYWAASRTDASGLTQSVLTRVRADLSGEARAMSASEHGVASPWKIAGIAADTAKVYLLTHAPNTSHNTIRAFTEAPSASTLFTSAPDAVAIAVDTTYVYWLTQGAQLWRRAKANGSSELLAAVPAPAPSVGGYRAYAMTQDARSLFFTTSAGLYRREK